VERLVDCVCRIPVDDDAAAHHVAGDVDAVELSFAAADLVG
jgi:hypothetical protein